MAPNQDIESQRHKNRKKSCSYILTISQDLQYSQGILEVVHNLGGERGKQGLDGIGQREFARDVRPAGYCHQRTGLACLRRST